MNKFFIFSVFVSLSLLAGTNAYFTFDLPEDWVAVSKENLAVFNQAEDAIKQQRRNPYCAAYQRKALFDFELPYILIEQEAHAPYSLPELQAMANALPSAIRNAYLPLHRAGKYGEVNVMPAFYDEERQMVFDYYEMKRAKPPVAMFAFTACFPSKKGLVKIHGFGKKSDYERSMAEMEKILQSFCFAPEYQDTPAEKSSNYKHVLPVICIISFLVLAGLRIYGRRASHSREPFSKTS